MSPADGKRRPDPPEQGWPVPDPCSILALLVHGQQSYPERRCMTDIAGLKPDTQAAAWMGVSVLLMSQRPLVVALVGGAVSPFVFQFWTSLTLSLVWFVYLLWASPDLVRRRDIWVWCVRRLRTFDGALAMLNGFNMSLFVWAALFIDTALVTVIAAGWPILFVFYRQRQEKQSNRYRHVAVQDWLLMAVAMAGVALVILSQTGGVTADGGWRLIWGVLLAVASAVSVSWISYRFKMGTDLHKKEAETSADRKDEVVCVLAVSTVASIPVIVGGLLIGLTVFPPDTGRGAGLAGFVSGPVVWIIASAIVTSLGTIAFRYANLETSNLGVNAMQYLLPVLSLVWLGVFATVTVYRTDILWVGAAAVISVNALINFRSEDRAGFKWLVLSLFGFGFVIYMRDEWFTHIPGYGWFPGFSDYYGVLGAGATVFVLILSFRTSRLAARTAGEDQQTYMLWRRLDALSADVQTRCVLLHHVRTIDTTRDITKLEEAYNYVTDRIEQAGLYRSEAAELQGNLDTLVNSKQKGRNLAELIVLVMLAFLVAGMAVFARTETQAWPALVNDVLSMLLASTVTFMTVHLFDRRSERDLHLITDTGKVKFRTLNTGKKHNPRVEQTITVGIGFAVIGIYIYLMALKWLPV